MSAFASPLFCNFKPVSNTVYYCQTLLARLVQWQWVLSVAIAQICCSCSAVFCCVDAKKSADLISQCCASFDPITKYFLFKFGGLIKQSPPFSFSNKRNVQRFLKPPVRITRNTILLFLHWWHSFSDVLISALCTPRTTQSSGADALNRRDPHFRQSNIV